LGEYKLPDNHFDAAIIGAGQAGNPLSRALAKAGWKTAIIERENIGGTCINVGCTPTKTMVASGRTAYLARRADGYGINIAAVSVDMGRVRDRKQAIVESFRSGDKKRLQNAENLTLLEGEASFIDSRTVSVRLPAGEQVITADKIFINAGARPSKPPLPGLDEIPFLDSTSVMELDTVPDHLLILGGGPIGLEFGQLFRRFGSQVTIVERDNQLLPLEDPDVADEVQKILEQDGVTVLLEANVSQLSRRNDGAIAVRTVTPAGEQEVTGSHLLLAIGRVPNTDVLNLPAAKVVLDERGYIKVNERLETSTAGIYALGDINGQPAFTHIAYDDYRIIEANLLKGGSRTTIGRILPYTIFIDPQLGRVGLSEREAREKGYDVRVAKMPMTYVARALEVDESRGFVKAVVDGSTGQILGCSMLGTEGGELMAMVQIAMMGKLRYTALRDVIFAHPTLAESLNNLFFYLEP
jgi:pyruvate/2-oxoglutarate dehydrogenase complex dihydrolipoamide dehydrogenase (E3) component